MTQYLKRSGHDTLAYNHIKAQGAGKDLPAILFCGGFCSDMEGTKALYLQKFCEKRGQEYMRFDYSGHGSSEGKFTEGSIGQWLNDALTIFDLIENNSVITVGSSMGGWISLLLGKQRAANITNIVGIAAAPDFTKTLYEQELNDEQRRAMDEIGYVDIPNEYSDEPYRFTKHLIEDGKDHYLLENSNHYTMPLYLLQGMQDTSVPWQVAHRIKNSVIDGNVEIRLIEDGDHSLSRPEDLELISAAIEKMSAKI